MERRGPKDDVEDLVAVPYMFRETPNSVKTLRRASKTKLQDLDPIRLQTELEGENDRSVVILLASLIDDALALRLSRSFCFTPTEDQLNSIFRFEGPLGTMSARIELAYLFGAISDDTFAQLDLIREMRNACAHSKLSLTFSDPALSNVARRLGKNFDRELPSHACAEAIKTSFIIVGLYLFVGLRMDPSDGPFPSPGKST